MNLFGSKKEERDIFTVKLVREGDETFIASQYMIDWGNPRAVADLCHQLKNQVKILEKALELQSAKSILKQVREENKELNKKMKKQLKEVESYDDFLEKIIFNEE